VPEATERFPRRAEKARQTRLALIAAATELFAERGYAGTTIEAIARQAGVARPTVFTAMPGGKPQLLKEARDIAIAGDDEPVPIPQRTWYRRTLAQTDPAVLLYMQSHNNRRILERVAALELVIRAAASDPALAGLAAEARRQRRFGAASITGRLNDLGALRPGLTHQAAGDVYYAIASPEVFILLTRDQGWTVTAYEEWLAGQLIHALLGSADGAGTA
jgi:TetR/AcrR family transcriptional regulator, regulator of autoinduction and epiphytic fitness